MMWNPETIAGVASSLATRSIRLSRRLHALVAAFACCLVLSCDGGAGGSLADNGGMSGTGVSQGSIGAFGSIFVNGVEWDLAGASIMLDGEAATESDLRLGMVVRIDGDFDPGDLTGSALSVEFDDSLEGPIGATPVETIAGLEKTFTILGNTIVVRSDTTIFDGEGASFATLMADDVLEVSGFLDAMGTIRATRVEAKGVFMDFRESELRGVVSNLVANPNGTGIFDLGSIVIRYTENSIFEDVTRATLRDGDLVEVEGLLRDSMTEIDAEKVEFETAGLGSGDLARVEIEGIVVLCPEPYDFCVSGVPVDTSGATFEPVGFMPMAGDAVEVEGPLMAGVLVATRVESEDLEDLSRTARIEARASSVDPVARTLVILGVTVTVDPDTTLEDKSSINDESFMFQEINVGDYLEVSGVDTATSAITATSIRREDATPGSDDVRLEGPVTFLDPGMPDPGMPPGLSILGQVVPPLDAGTLYFDSMGAPRSEEEFFRNPGDVMLGDIVSVKDVGAGDLSLLTEANEVELESP